MKRDDIKLCSKIKPLIGENGRFYFAKCYNFESGKMQRTEMEVLPNSLLSLGEAEISIKSEAPTIKEILNFIQKNKLKGIKAYFVRSVGYNNYINKMVARVAFYGYQKGFEHQYENAIANLDQQSL